MVGQIRQGFRRKLNPKNWYFYTVAALPPNRPVLLKHPTRNFWMPLAYWLSYLLGFDESGGIKLRIYLNYWKARKDYIKRGGQ